MGESISLLSSVIAALFISMIIDILARKFQIGQENYLNYALAAFAIALLAAAGHLIWRNLARSSGRDSIYVSNGILFAKSPLPQSVQINNIVSMEIETAKTLLFKNNECLIIKTNTGREMRINSSYHDRSLMEIRQRLKNLPS